jgi:hypothetical protein
MAQPVSRRRVWLTKTSLVGVALACVFIALCVSVYWRVNSVLEAMKTSIWKNAFSHPGESTQYFLRLVTDIRHEAFRDTLIAGALPALAGFAGGLWTTLLLRQVSAAFWLTFLVPTGLAMATGWIFGLISDTAATDGVIAIIAAYSAMGFVGARRLFLTGQDTQWTGGIVSLPDWRRSRAETGAGGSDRRSKPLRALLRRELHSNQINLLLAGGLLLLNLAVITFRKFGAEYLSMHGAFRMTLETFPLLWLALPLMVGSVAVAEERKLGTLETSLALPPSRRIQFIMKLGFVVVLSLLLGSVVPWLIEALASLLNVIGNSSGLMIIGQTRELSGLLLVGSAGLGLLSFYGSTLTRNTLQAMGAGVLASCLAFVITAVAADPPPIAEIYLWSGRLAGRIAGPVMALMLLGLAYRNFKILQPDLRTLFRNVRILLSALVALAALTTLIYHRAWEAWLPEEPKHGFFPAIFAGPDQRVTEFGPAQWQERTKLVKVETSPARVAVLLPRGRLWLRQRPVKQIKLLSPAGQVYRVGIPKGSWHAGFVEGSNWRDVAVSGTNCFAIGTDGSLWDLSDLRWGRSAAAAKPKRVGQGGLWKAISGGNGQFISESGGHFTALKGDGTIWEWGARLVFPAQTFHAQTVLLETTPEPRRVGTDDDWAAVSESAQGDGSVAVKTDGTIWRWGRVHWVSTNGTSMPRLTAVPEKWLEGIGVVPVSLSFSGNALAVVSPDGELWLWGKGGNAARLLGPRLAGLAERELVRWGIGSDWKEVRLHWWHGAVGVKRDGSLWQWDPRRPLPTVGGWAAPATRPSQYEDWVAVCPMERAFLALAHDGSLCEWEDEEEAYIYYFYERARPDPSRLLQPSRIKAWKVAEVK